MRKPNPNSMITRIWNAIDKAVFSLLLGAILYLFLPIKRTLPIFFLLYLGTVCAVLLASKASTAYRTRRMNRRKAEERRFVSMLLKSDAEIGKAIGEPHLVLIRSDRPDRYALIDAVRSGAGTVAVATNIKEAKAFLSEYAPNVRVIGFEDLMRAFCPEQIEKRDLPLFRKCRDLFGSAFMKYGLLAAVCFLLSFAVRFKIYYRLLSTLCVILATTTGFLHDTSKRKNL